jgi:hypothetical protein
MAERERAGRNIIPIDAASESAAAPAKMAGISLMQDTPLRHLRDSPNLKIGL